jgi:hypothetical protein
MPQRRDVGKGLLSETRGKVRSSLDSEEFDRPTKNIDSYEIKLPEGYTVDDLPPPVDADYSFASYHSKAKGNVLTYTRTMKIKELSVPVEKLEQLKSHRGDERNTAALKPAGK